MSYSRTKGSKNSTIESIYDILLSQKWSKSQITLIPTKGLSSTSTVTGSFLQSRFLSTQVTAPRVSYYALVVKVVLPKYHEPRVMLRFMAGYSKAQVFGNPNDWTSSARSMVELSNKSQRKSQIQNKPHSHKAIDKRSKCQAGIERHTFAAEEASSCGRFPPRKEDRSILDSATPVTISWQIVPVRRRKM